MNNLSEPGADGNNELVHNSPAVGPARVEDESRRELRERVTSGSAMLRNIRYPLTDWSSSGICMRDYDGNHSVGDRVHAWVHIDCADTVFTFKCELLLVRLDPVQQQLAGVFVTLDRPDRVAIAAHFEALEQAVAQRAGAEPPDDPDIGGLPA